MLNLCKDECYELTETVPVGQALLRGRVALEGNGRRSMFPRHSFLPVRSSLVRALFLCSSAGTSF